MDIDNDFLDNITEDDISAVLEKETNKIQEAEEFIKNCEHRFSHSIVMNVKELGYPNLYQMNRLMRRISTVFELFCIECSELFIIDDLIDYQKHNIYVYNHNSYKYISCNNDDPIKRYSPDSEHKHNDYKECAVIYFNNIPLNEKHLMKFGDCLQKSIQNTFIKKFYITDYIFIPNRFQKVKVYYINNILYLKKMKLIQ